MYVTEKLDGVRYNEQSIPSKESLIWRALACVRFE